MKTVLISFASSTTGSRLKNLAAKEQIRNVSITQTPKGIKTGGCSYSLRVDERDLDLILSIAQKHRISYIGIYAENYDIRGNVVYRRL